MSADSKKVFLKDYQPPQYLIPEIQLDFTLNEEETLVKTQMKLEANPQAQPSKTLTLIGEEMELVDIKLDGTPLAKDRYTATPDSLTITGFPAKATLETTTRIFPQNNKAFSGLYKTKKIFCTQMEAEGFRRVTYFLDRPDVLSKYTTRITADKSKYPNLLSNGNLAEQKDLDGGRHYACWEDPFPKPCYLFALVAGDLDWVEDTYLTMSKKKVDLRVYVEKGKADRARHAMNCLKQSMKWDEDTYGLEYDLHIYNVVAVDDFNMGAMENKGLNVFNSKYVLADTQSATDDEFTGILRVIGHEYFHNWSGNRVTCRDWFQLSLKEGLTVYRDQEFTCDLTSRSVKRIEDVDLLRSRQFPEDAGPMAHPVRPPSYISIDNFYTATVYIKGAEVIRMMQNILGLEMFKKGLAKYFELYDGQAVTTDDFAHAMETVSGKDLSTFKRWYDQAGTPEVSVSANYNQDSQTLTVDFKQRTLDPITQKENQPYHIPIRLGLLSETGAQLEYTEGESGDAQSETLFELTDAQATLELKNVKSKPVLSILRGFSAPVKMNFEQPNDELYLLMTKDPDSFNRWESGQKIYLKTLINFYQDIKDGKTPEFPQPLAEALAHIISNGSEDPALAAQLLRKPSPHYVIQFLEDVDPQALVKAYRTFNNLLNQKLGGPIVEAYKALAEKTLGQSQADIGLRSYKNTLLSLLGENEQQVAVPTAAAQFASAQNMTDKLAALSKLSHWSTPESEQALKQFYTDWKGDALVINKWLSIKALSRQDNAFAEVEKVTTDPVYDKTNPNNIYALLLQFASENWQHFHNPSGQTYQWLADRILDIDSRNPQVASRLASVFNPWKKFAGLYGEEMKKALEKMASQETSKNLYEIVSRALNS